MVSLPEAKNEKAVRLVEYLQRLASLGTRLLRDVNDYDKVFWISDIPRQKGCFTQAWGRDERYDSDVWIEIRAQHEPELPAVPEQCRDWIDQQSLGNKSDLPELRPHITVQTRNPNYRENSDQPEFVNRVERLDDHAGVREEWDRYLEEHWLPWTERHNVWDGIHKAYSALFSINQEQLRLGEEYELILGLGPLTWQTPTGQRVRRHLVVANAVLEFESHLGKFTVRPAPDGANLRPELDMLDIEEQPEHAEEAARRSLAAAEEDPWDRNCLDGVLQALAHSISPEGEYSDALEATGIRVSSKPVVEFAPALILRRRSSRGLTETLKRIKERIERGEDIPGEFCDLAEISAETGVNVEGEPGRTSDEFGNDIFFPKHSNEEQRRIVDKMRGHAGVLVQGPPGTGKSHTIANLICHLLATGQRILVTAKTPRALKVVEGLLPEDLRSLSINLLGSGLEEKRSLESSVNGILRRNEEWHEERAIKEREELGQHLQKLREEKAATERRLRDIRESETHTQVIGEGAYRGTAARIAEAVNRDRGRYEWFADAVLLDQACPISERDARNVLEGLRAFPAKNRLELARPWPDHLPAPERVCKLFDEENKAREEEARSAEGADEETAGNLSKIDSAAVTAFRDSLSVLLAECERLSGLPHPWVRDALRDVRCGDALLWRELHRVTQDTATALEPLVEGADRTSIDLPDGVNLRGLLEDACKLRQHMESGGKLGWGPFRPSSVRERMYILKTVRVNGRHCRSRESLSILAKALSVRVECEKAWGFWAGRCERTQGPYALQLRALMGYCGVLGEVLSLEEHIRKCRETLPQVPALGKPDWTDDWQIGTWIDSCRLALAREKRVLAVGEIRDIEKSLEKSAAERNSHHVTGELLQAVRKRDMDSYQRCWNTIANLAERRQRLEKLDEDIARLRNYLPRLTTELERACLDDCWDTRVAQIGSAWRLAQARTWIEEYIRKEDVPSLEKRARQMEDEICETIAKLTSIRAWSFCLARLEEDHRRHMAAWQQSMKKLGRGTGKHAAYHRRQAQQHLNQCRQAVPAWVMPLHRIWDTVDPAPGMFDVIIVDEASQCGFEALPLFYLGKRILIVGDDKQISPEAVGLARDAVHRLMREFLFDFKFKSSFDVESSLFDHGKLRYGKGQITLREHFRCMPEIIRFSNDLCYADTPLIPLRQYGPDRLGPLEHILVDRGYREGSDNRVINRAEADAIAEKVAELCRSPEYAGKSMGVVVLQGEAQANLIEQKLLDLLGAEEMEKRRLICGNPYNFQGDERDVIFLSMVAGTNERIGALSKPGDERRFNVAASRARDQMWLFHSVRREDLSTLDLRRGLLEFFEDTQPQKIAGIDRDELERGAARDNRSVVRPPQPFGSWFEVDVALELLRRGYLVMPQYEVAKKWIDLVVEGGLARLAVECDGDHWHGPDKFDEDMQRQRQLERCGWTFFRVRESVFYADKRMALEHLWRLLEERGIMPQFGAGSGEERGASAFAEVSQGAGAE